MKRQPKLEVELRAAQTRVSRLSQLLEVSSLLTSSLELPQVLQAIVKATTQILEVEAASILLLNETTGHLTFAAATGPRADAVPYLTIPSGKGICGWVARHGRPLVINDVARDRRFFPGIDQATRFRTKALLAAPLQIMGKAIGVLEALNKRNGGSFSAEDLELAEAFARQAAIALNNAKLYQEALEKRRLDEELRVAEQIQRSLLPQELPRVKGFEFAALNVPSLEVGGDYYDFVPCAEDLLAVAIGDVSGKGVPAALLLASLQATLRSNLMSGHALWDTMRKTNLYLCKTTALSKFVTLFLGLLDLSHRDLFFINAGHNYPLLRRRKGHILPLTKGGVVLGILEEVKFEIEKIDLQRGDLVLMYTDGVTEARNHRGEMFGSLRLRRLLDQSATLPVQGLLERIAERVRTFSGQSPQADDLTLVAIKVK